MVSFLSHLRVSWNITLDGVRADVRRLTKSLGRKDSHLIALRTWETLIIPSASDSEELRDWKYHKVYQDLCNSYLGCTVGIVRKRLVVLQLVPMVKAGMINSAIKETFMKGREFLINQISNLDLDLSKDPADFGAHPIVIVLLEFLKGAQSQ